MPIEASRGFGMLLWGLQVFFREEIEQGQEFAFDHVVVACVPAAFVRKHQIASLLALGAQLPFLQHQNERLGDGNNPHSRGGLCDVLFAIGVDPRLDLDLTFRQIGQCYTCHTLSLGVGKMSAAKRFGASEQIRISQLSIFNLPPRPSIMAVIKSYFDDSRPNDRIWAIGGYAGHDLQWEEFETRWPAMLDKHDVPYFHMREMGKPNGVYSKWHPPKEHESERAAFFNDLTQVIGDCWLRGFWSITRVDHLERFNSETGMRLEPYPLAAYGCMLMLGYEYENISIEMFFDRVEKVTSKLATASEYAESDKNYGRSLDWMTPIPLAKNLTFRNVRPLQAADFYIWELQRNHLNADEWHSISDKPTLEDERWRHFQEWSRAKFGTDHPPPRKSLASLMDRAAPVTGIIWDYDNLTQAHRARGGVWV